MKFIDCILGSIFDIDHCTDEDIAESHIYQHGLVAQALAASRPEGKAFCQIPITRWLN